VNARDAAAPTPHSAVETAYLPPEVVLYDERTGAVYRLNPSASAVWLLLDGAADHDAITGQVADIYGLPPEQLHPDVGRALAMFSAQGLLVTGDYPTTSTVDGPDIRVPDDIRAMLTSPPEEGEIAVPLAVFTRAGRAVLALADDPASVDVGLLAEAGVVRLAETWSFVSPDGTTVTSGTMRWPLVGAVIAGREPLDVVEARRRLWDHGRGNRGGWEHLLGLDGWVTPADDVNAAIVDALA
jgi:hypothetical protein